MVAVHRYTRGMKSSVTPAKRALIGRALIAFAMVAAAGGADAHDLWLFPDRFEIDQGDLLVVRQLLGAELTLAGPGREDVEELPLLLDLTFRFELLDSSGTTNLLRRSDPAEGEPVLARRMDAEGLALISMEHEYIYHMFPNQEFVDYLVHEELDPAGFREHMGERAEQGEAYARGMKSLVRVGAVLDGDLYGRELGQKLEILLLQNPYALDFGDQIEARILFDGEPLAGELVFAYTETPSGGVTKLRSRTDDDGVARFPIDQTGAWLIKLVHIRPCAPESEVECLFADWESYWSSYSFAID